LSWIAALGLHLYAEPLPEIISRCFAEQGSTSRQSQLIRRFSPGHKQTETSRSKDGGKLFIETGRAPSIISPGNRPPAAHLEA